MLRRSLDAFISRDSEAATKISAEDDEVDDLYDQVYRELLTYMAEDPRVTNICERVVFTVTGKMEEIGASKY